MIKNMLSAAILSITIFSAPISAFSQNRRNTCVILPNQIESCSTFANGKLVALTQNTFEINGRQMAKNDWQYYANQKGSICGFRSTLTEYTNGFLHTAYTFFCR